MAVIDAPRSILRLGSNRGDLAAFEATGQISEPDMVWTAGELDRAFGSSGQIDLIVIMTNFDGADAGAVLSLEAGSVLVKSPGQVGRHCVVGAPALTRTMIGTFRWPKPVQEKTFGLHEATAAWRRIEEERAAPPA